MSGQKRTAPAQLRLGLCCQFAQEPIQFRTTTATAMLRLSKRERLARLAELGRSYGIAAASRKCMIRLRSASGSVPRSCAGLKVPMEL